MSSEGGNKKIADYSSLASSQARIQDDPDKTSGPLPQKQSQSNVFPHPKQTLSNVYPQHPSPNIKTIYVGQDVRKRLNLNEEIEGAVVCSGSNAGRLDYCADKVVMGGNLIEVCKEKTNNDSHTGSSREIFTSDTKEVDMSTAVEGTGKAILCEPEEVSDTEADVSSSTTQDDNAVMHTFTFPLGSHRRGEILKSHRKDNVSYSCKEIESESHSVTNGQMSEGHLHSDSSVFKPKSRGKKPHGIKESGKDGRDSDSSVSSRKKGLSKRTKIKSKFTSGSLEYFKEHLVGRIFSGWVEERQWVEGVAGYRDVVEVDEWEVAMNQQLNAIVSSIPGVQEGTRWINITPPSTTSPSYCLWVLLAAPPCPGHYWFIITAVHSQPQFGLRIVLKEIRQINPHDGESLEARQKRRGKENGGGQGGGRGLELENLSQQVQEWFDQLCSLNWASIWAALVSTITITNIKETFRFVVVLVMTMVLGLVTVVRESHHAGLCFIREGGIFLHNITPFLQSVLGFVEKLVGGFYLLIAMVYRDIRRPGPTPPSSHYPPIHTPTTSMSSTPYVPRQIKYVPPESWVYKNQNQEPPHS